MISIALICTVEHQWLEHLRDHGNLFEVGLFEPLRVNHSDRSVGKWDDLVVSIRFFMKQMYFVWTH